MCEKEWGFTGSGVCIQKVPDKTYDCTITGRIKELLGKAISENLCVYLLVVVRFCLAAVIREASDVCILREPAFRFEVKDPEWYQDYMRDQWKREAAWKMEQRCIICGENGKSKRCSLRNKNPEYTGKKGEKKTLAISCESRPFDRQLRPVKGTVFFSSLELRDKDGNVDPYEPESGRYSTADDYLKMLHDFIEYVRTRYPKYAHYTELIEILGEKVEMKEIAARMNKPDKTLYGWLKKLRPIFDEFKDTVDYL